MRRICAAACIAIALVCVGGVATPLTQAYAPNGDQGWYWQMPQPAGHLYDVTFATDTDAWAVGTGGTILHSGDAGLTWTAQQSGTFDDLHAVSFVDALHGWACGCPPLNPAGKSVILATSNGGTTWTDVTPAGLTRKITSIVFADTLHGWAGLSGGYQLRTIDGGTSWKTLHVGSASGAVLVDFVSASRGWALETSAKRLWRTANGGASWRIAHQFTSRVAGWAGLDFTDATHGWVVTYHGSRYRLCATADGGRTWRVVWQTTNVITSLDASDVSTVTVASIQPNSDLQTMDLRPTEDLTSWLNGFSFSGPTSLRHTSDGGHTWTHVRIGSSSMTAAIAGRGPAWCYVGSAILNSQDAAATWRSVSSGQPYFLCQGVAVSATNLWAVDVDGAVVHSGDGTHWVEQPTPVPWSQHLYGVSFPDASDGWLVGTSGQSATRTGLILHTTDGGATWSPQTSVLASDLSGVDFVDAVNGWAISGNSSYGSGSGALTGVEHTTDGGATWIALYVPNNPDVYALDFVDASTGWVAGNYYKDSATGGTDVSVIDKTTNGGLTWTQETLPAGRVFIMGLQFLDANEGWAAGVTFSHRTLHSWLAHTTDGGTTWTRITTLPGAIALSVHFVDSQHGWVGGDGVWATSDGGTSWTQVAAGTTPYAIAATDADHVWAFGGGIISTLDASGDTAPPMTFDDADWGWHRNPVTITLTPGDSSGSGLAGTEFSADGGSSWTSGATIDVAAPADHTKDGLHRFLYRSSDNAGNVEATEICGVGIDTVGPTCTAPKAVVADVGKPAIIRFTADDATSGAARATISIVNHSGKVVRTLVARAGYWVSDSPPPYDWLRFTCNLKPGLYRIEVRAVDRAGNRQATVGHNSLRVVVSGAPSVRWPWWPPGLPITNSALASMTAGPTVARLSGNSGDSTLIGQPLAPWAPVSRLLQAH